MTSSPDASRSAAPDVSRRAQRPMSEVLRAALPFLSLALVLVAIGWLNPRAISYLGFNLMLNLAVPVALAGLSQMFVITVNDLDLSLGFFVTFVACILVTAPDGNAPPAILALVGGLAIYGAAGALIHLRALPSIVVTLGMSFVWQGLALMVLPQPGGRAPEWLSSLFEWRAPFAPLPVWLLLAMALIAHFGLAHTAAGALLRGAGGNPRAVERAGWSLLKIRIAAFLLAGTFAILSALALTGISTAADANIGSGYTLLSIAAVILGGGEFTGGRTSALGTVAGAVTLTLASASLLSFLRIPPDWQIGANGVILITVLAIRALIGRKP